MPRVLRIQRHTVLIVHEGYAEGHLLKHLRGLYVARGAGVTIKLRNAGGWGGKHVLEVALRVRLQAAYDEVAILLDTDKDWDNAQRRKAADHGIQALESSPCLEAWLLAVHGHSTTGNTAQLKRRFEKIYAAEAHAPDVYARHFSKEDMERARERVAVLEQILKLMRV